jgi:hypothetical protein
MTVKNEAMNPPTLDGSIESAPWPPDAQTMKAIVQEEYGSTPDVIGEWDLLAGSERPQRPDIDRPASCHPTAPMVPVGGRQ